MLLADNAVLRISWAQLRDGLGSYIERMDSPCHYLRLGESYLFNCCGASPIDCLSYNFQSEEDIQNFVCFVYRHLAPSQTYYMLAATKQLDEAETGKFGNTIQLLRKLGAKEVDDTPNRYHGPNLMHLHRWVIDKGDWSIWAPYLAKQGLGVNPLWYSKLTDEQKATVSADAGALKVAYDARTKRAKELKDKQKKDDLVYKARRLIDSGALTEYLQQMGWEKKNGIEQKSIPVDTTGGSTKRFVW